MSGPLDIISPVTISNFAYDEWDGLSQNHYFYKVLKQKGQIDYDCDGTDLRQPVEGGRYQPFISAPGQDISPFLGSNTRFTQAVFTWAELCNSFKIDAGALRRNDGAKTGLVRLTEKEVPRLIKDILVGGTSSLHHQILNQNISSPTGTGATTGLPIGGLPSALLAPGATGLIGSNGIPAGNTGLGAPTYTGVAPAATDREAVPGTASQTYGTLSMAPVGSNGAGTGGISTITNAEFDVWTPTLVNTTSTAFGSSSAETNVLKWTQWAAQRSMRFDSNDTDKLPSFGIMATDHFNFLSNAIAAKQTIMLMSGGSGTDPANPGLGVVGGAGKSLYTAGLTWFWDAAMPASATFIVNMRQFWLKVQPIYKGLISPSSPFKSGEDAGLLEMRVDPLPLSRGWAVSATFPGQALFNPRYMTRCSAYA